MSVTNVLAVVSVADFDAARIWYERLLGRPADRLPMPGCAEWQITANGGLQVVRDARRAGQSFLTLGVDDIHRHVDYLAGRGLAAGAIRDNHTGSGEATRITSITDPSGNVVTFGEGPVSGPIPGRV